MKRLFYVALGIMALGNTRVWAEHEDHDDDKHTVINNTYVTKWENPTSPRFNTIIKESIRIFDTTKFQGFVSLFQDYRVGRDGHGIELNLVYKFGKSTEEKQIEGLMFVMRSLQRQLDERK